MLRSYRIREVEGDRYGGALVAQASEKPGVEYRAAERSRSDLYLDFLPLVNAGRAEALDVPRLVARGAIQWPGCPSQFCGHAPTPTALWPVMGTRP